MRLDTVLFMKFVRNYGTALAIAVMAIAIGAGALDPTAGLSGRIARGVAVMGLFTLSIVIFSAQRKTVKTRKRV